MDFSTARSFFFSIASMLKEKKMLNINYQYQIYIYENDFRMDLYLQITMFIFGLIIGSFLNVVILRKEKKLLQLLMQ